MRTVVKMLILDIMINSECEDQRIFSVVYSKSEEIVQQENIRKALDIFKSYFPISKMYFCHPTYLYLCACTVIKMPIIVIMLNFKGTESSIFTLVFLKGEETVQYKSILKNQICSKHFFPFFKCIVLLSHIFVIIYEYSR